MPNLIERRRRLLTLCLLWALLLAVLAIQPDSLVEFFLPFSILRDGAHTATHGILVFFLCLYLRFRRHVFKVPMTFLNATLLAFFLAAGWGGFTEWMQQFVPGRYVSLKDLAYDMVGALFGIAFFRLKELGVV